MADSDVSVIAGNAETPDGSRTGLLGNPELRRLLNAYAQLQSSAVLGEHIPIPEIIIVGGQSDGKSSLLEALLGFHFNVREVEMGTRRPLLLQMTHDPLALEPCCRLQEEESEEYGPPIVPAATVSDMIRVRTETHLKLVGKAVSPKPIVMSVHYAHCPNLTLIDTPGFILESKKGEPAKTPEDIVEMVKELAAPPQRLILFLQQSSVEWCSSLWLPIVRKMDPDLSRTIVVVSKFDNRLKEFESRWEVDRYLSANGYLGNLRPFFVALPKERLPISNEDFRTKIVAMDEEVVVHLRSKVAGGFNEEAYRSQIGLATLRKYLEEKLQERYREAVPGTLALLEKRCSDVEAELAKANSHVAELADTPSHRSKALQHVVAMCERMKELLNGSVDPDPERHGQTSAQEKGMSRVGDWPGVPMVVTDLSELKLHGGAAFKRVLDEFEEAARSLTCPLISEDKVTTFFMGPLPGKKSVEELAANFARRAVKDALLPLLETVCRRLTFVMGRLFPLAAEWIQSEDGNSDIWAEGREGAPSPFSGFHAALHDKYEMCVAKIASDCLDRITEYLTTTISPYAQTYLMYMGDEDDTSDHDKGDSDEEAEGAAVARGGSPVAGLEISPSKSPVGQSKRRKEATGTQEDPHRVVPETPSSQLAGAHGGDDYRDGERGDPFSPQARQHGSRYRAATVEAGPSERNKRQRLYLNADRRGKRQMMSKYDEVCVTARKLFSAMRNAVVANVGEATLTQGFLKPFLVMSGGVMQDLMLECVACSDAKFIEMFASQVALARLQSDKADISRRAKVLRKCYDEFKAVAQF